MSRYKSNIVENILYIVIMKTHITMNRVLMQMNRIRELRKRMEITQKELAGHLQIADSTLSYWEMGKYEPDSDALMKLSRFFSVPIDYILGGDFTKWDIKEENVLHHGADTSNSATDLSVSEAHVSYKESTSSNSTHDYDDALTAFDRTEFQGLSQDELDLLAEYAVFIKSRRKTD